MNKAKIAAVLWCLAVTLGWLALAAEVFRRGSENGRQWLIIVSVAAFFVWVVRFWGVRHFRDATFPDRLGSWLPPVVLMGCAVAFGVIFMDMEPGRIAITALIIALSLMWVPAAATVALGWFWPDEREYYYFRAEPRAPEPEKPQDQITITETRQTTVERKRR